MKTFQGQVRMIRVCCTYTDSYALAVAASKNRYLYANESKQLNEMRMEAKFISFAAVIFELN